ncbi:MAG: AI-2E family transporter [Clostridia bacterium]|nr:AI-2E family transporter [Clostridia bacterium]
MPQEKTQKGRLGLAVAVYVAIFVLLLFVSNIDAFSNWIGNLLLLLRPILIGLVLAYLLNPFFRFFERKLFQKIHPHALRRGISLVFTYLTLTLIFALLLVLIVPQLVESIANFIDNFDSYIETAAADFNGFLAGINSVLPKKADGSGMIPFLNAEEMKESFSKMMSSLHIDAEMISTLITFDTLTMVGSILKNLVSILTDTIFGIFISLYLLNTKELRYAQIMRLRRAFFSDKVNERITNVCATADRSFGGFLKGKVLDSAIIGVLVYLAISLLGVPYAILIAAIVAITDIVPIIGPFIGVIPSAVIILLTEPKKVIPFLLCILIVQQIDGNIIAPKILGENTGVSSLCVIVAITTMGSIWGLAGMVLGVPLFATVLELSGAWLDKRLQKKGLPTDTDSYLSAELTEAKKAKRTSSKGRARKKNSRNPELNLGGAGDLNGFERLRLDAYDLACRHGLFSDGAEAALASVTAERAAGISEDAPADSEEEPIAAYEENTAPPEGFEPNEREDEQDGI